MKRSAIFRVFAAASVCVLSGARARSQSAPSPLPQQQDRSFYIGTPVTHPEDLSGVWEAPDGHGGAIGIHLILDTTAPVDATTLLGTEQKWLGLDVGLYHRTGSQLQLGEENLFSDSLRGGSVRYEDGRLTLHFRGDDAKDHSKDNSGDDLDLHRIAGDRWSGRFHRGNFDAPVTLARPMLQATSNSEWFLGTWRSGDGPNIQCLHIAKQTAAGYTGWSDTLSAWGSVSFAPQVAKPPYSWEHYGELAKIERAEDRSLWIEIPAYSAICCSHRFHATSADAGKAMKADWPAGPNQTPHKSKWIKMLGDTCIVRPLH
ncbi:MAG: hypothetical protein ACJ71S_11980 [Acidobacteriaceae bacterium]